jgi:hypothetical protein
LQEIEAELARHIGPLAKVLVRKAQAVANGAKGLREALAPSIQDAKAREGFLMGPDSRSRVAQGHSQTMSRPFSQPSSQPMSQPMSRPASGSNTGFASSQSVPLGSSAGSTARYGASVPMMMNLTPEEIATIELTLSKFIGPMARMLVRKEMGRSSSYPTFIKAVAGNIDQVPQRDVFLQAIARALPSRKQ